MVLALGLPSGGDIRFRDRTLEAGIDFVHYNARTEEKYMVETMGSGGGFFDFDGDGALDLYLVQGAPLPGSAAPPSPPKNALYRNDGRGRFEDVTEEAGVAGSGYGMGMTAGDVDNDGDLDLYVTSFGGNVFYRNRGDGTFEERTREAGLETDGWSTSAAFADYDQDGYLDLYVARYVDFALDNHKFCGNQAKGIKAYCHPDVYDPVPGILFRGKGDGTFEDVTRQAGVYVEDEGKGLGVVWGDYDNDGDSDLYVANDSMRSFLFRNDGSRFTDVTLLAGVGYSADGKTQAGMGTDIADYDGDGFLDLTKTNLDFEYNSMYRGGAAGIFSDESYASGIAEVSLNFVGFGTFFFDFDNDGLLDIFVANGHIIDNIHLFNSVSTYREPNFLFENQGVGVFREIGASVGDDIARENVARGAAPADYDSDGDLDVLVTRCGDRPLLLENDGGNRRKWLSVRLVGRASNRDAVGARATLITKGSIPTEVFREVKSGLSYLSQGSLDLHFGLGDADAPRSLEIRWPGGASEIIESPEASTLLLVVQGAGRIPRANIGLP
jgi:enediyne biosynthesis protein E4